MIQIVCPVMGRMLAVLLVVGSLAACSSDDEIAYVERPPEELYLEASAAIDSGAYSDAAQLFDEVERQHPYSQWATRAKLMAAYAHYQDLEYDDAILALDRFIQLHPGNKDIAYAYYLRALSYYEQISDVGRDQRMTELALDGLIDVVRRFPNSTYARDAQIKVDLARDHLAGKEMEIGRFYMNQGNVTAAIGRFRRVVDTFQTTSHTPEALLRLTEAYMSLGLIEEAQASAAVLGHNYPGSDWYEDAYALLDDGYVPTYTDADSPWWEDAWDAVF